MGILDGIVSWIAEQVMHGLDLITTSVLGALGCDMAVFVRYFPAAETMYHIFVALGIGLILLNWGYGSYSKIMDLGQASKRRTPSNSASALSSLYCLPTSLMKLWALC